MVTLDICGDEFVFNFCAHVSILVNTGQAEIYAVLVDQTK